MWRITKRGCTASSQQFTFQRFSAVPLWQADQLPLQACLRLALLLETGASAKEDVQAQSDQVMQRIDERLQVLVKDEAAAVLADAALLEAVASLFGRWHAMLNCDMRRKVWLALPFELLQVRLMRASCQLRCLGLRQWCYLRLLALSDNITLAAQPLLISIYAPLVIVNCTIPLVAGHV